MIGSRSMRCARCDRLAIPQALGHSPKGQLVYGWCLDCLEETGCTGIQIAWRSHSFRRRHRRATRPLRATPDRRSGALALIALLLMGWGVVLALGGLWKAVHPPANPPSTLGNGTPGLLLAGAGALGTIGLIFLAIALARVRWFWRALEILLFLCALVILTVGIVKHDPRRDPWFVAFAGFALGLSVLVHWRQRFQFLHRVAADSKKSTEILQNDEKEGESTL